MPRLISRDIIGASISAPWSVFCFSRERDHLWAWKNERYLLLITVTLQNLVAPIHTLLRAIDTYVTPRAARAYRERGISALTRMLRLTYLVAGIPTLGLLAFGFIFRSELLKLFYGDLYLEYTPGVILMVVFYALLYLQWPLQWFFAPSSTRGRLRLLTRPLVGSGSRRKIGYSNRNLLSMLCLVST